MLASSKNQLDIQGKGKNVEKSRIERICNGSSGVVVKLNRLQVIF